MKSYPYIGKSTYGLNCFSVAVFCSNNFGALLENNVDSNPLCEFGSDFNDSVFKNITAEYLTNTYGEVKSKEHAEFIVKLATENNIKIRYASFRDGIKSFEVSNGILYLYCLKVSQLSVTDKKQITIPLPPECESVAEWPKVGDEILLSDKLNSKNLEWFVGRVCKVIGICFDGGNKVLTIKDGGRIASLYDGGWVKKPKTPEQELRDEQIQTMSQKIRNKIPKISWDEAESISADLYDFGYRKPQ